MNCHICNKENPENLMRCILGKSSNDLYICDTCVDKFAGGGEILALIGKDIVTEGEELAGAKQEAIKKALQLKCSNCEASLEEIGMSGLFGCEQCYITFSDLIAMADAKIEDKNNKLKDLVGCKYEENEKEDLPIQNPIEEISELDKLKIKLDQAIKMENYEEAAKIRDEIEKVKNNG